MCVRPTLSWAIAKCRERLFAVVLTISVSLPPVLAESATAADITGSGIQALSLKALQKRALAAKDQIPTALAELAGFKRILGYVTDEENQDVVLYGTIASRFTNSLYTEDLCVALRNDWMKYARLEGNTYEYTNPGCTIDPEPATWDKLSKVSRSVNSDGDSQENQRQLDQWRQICQEWQNVRVLGTPTNCRFAATAVKADYDMKLLVDGNDTLDIPGFESLMGMRLAAVRHAVLSRSALTVPVSAMNRFWFYPGPNRYVADDGIVWIKECPVILLTEEEERQIGSKRGFSSAGRVNPLAQKFARNFSSLYSKVAEERPIYNDLENLFRFVALAKILHSREMPIRPGLNLDSKLECGLDLTCLLEEFPIGATEVAEKLRGRSGIKEFKHESSNGNQTTTYQLWLQSCGGVEINMEVSPENFVEPSGILKRLKRAILESKPANSDALSWNLPKASEAVVEIEVAGRIASLNPDRRRRSTVLVEYKNSIYRLFSDAGRIYDGENLSGLVTAFRASGLLDSGHLAIQTSGIGDKALPDFKAGLRSQLEKIEPSLFLTFVNKDNAESDIFEAVALPGMTLDPPSQLAESSASQDQPNSRSLSFKVRAGGKNQKCSVEVSSANAEWTRRVIDGVLKRLSPNGASAESLLDCMLEEKLRLKKSKKLQSIDIQIRFRGEGGTMEIGAIVLKENGQFV